MMLEWSAVVPVRPWWLAPDRLGRTPEQRADLARAIALDTLETVSQVESIGHVVVVTAEPEAAAAARRHGMTVMADRPLREVDPLNAAVGFGVRWIGGRRPGRPVVVLPGDLPCATAESVEDALGRLAPHPAAFVADASGRGATLVSTQVPGDFRGRFGPSAALAFSRSGYRAVAGADARVRHDVDGYDDLEGLGLLGIGPCTEALLTRTLRGRRSRPVRRVTGALGRSSPVGVT